MYAYPVKACKMYPHVVNFITEMDSLWHIN